MFSIGTLPDCVCTASTSVRTRSPSEDDTEPDVTLALSNTLRRDLLGAAHRLRETPALHAPSPVTLVATKHRHYSSASETASMHQRNYVIIQNEQNSDHKLTYCNSASPNQKTHKPL